MDLRRFHCFHWIQSVKSLFILQHSLLGYNRFLHWKINMTWFWKWKYVPGQFGYLFSWKSKMKKEISESFSTDALQKVWVNFSKYYQIADNYLKQQWLENNIHTYICFTCLNHNLKIFNTLFFSHQKLITNPCTNWPWENWRLLIQFNCFY